MRTTACGAGRSRSTAVHFSSSYVASQYRRGARVVANSGRPRVFVSYCWESGEHVAWVRALAERLLLNGIDVVLDQWSLSLGDSTTLFIEEAIRTSDFVLIICTPEYKARSDSRLYGVGYEAELMAAQRLLGHTRNFIPILRRADWLASMPAWVHGTLGVDLRGEPFEDANFSQLLAVLKREREFSGTQSTPSPCHPRNSRRRRIWRFIVMSLRRLK
ncbi:MAG: toll/interleukin-1 receptor domain-containing protein [Candidatus Binataceae bacterium]